MNVLIVDRPGAFRDALVGAMRARGADVHASDGALDALGKLRELSPGVIVVSDAAGPPDVASTARLMRRQLGDVAVYHLHDPALGDSAPDTLSLSRHEDVGDLARALVGESARSEPRVSASAAPSIAPDLDEPLDELVELVTDREAAPVRPAPPPPPPAGVLPAREAASKEAAFREAAPKEAAPKERAPTSGVLEPAAIPAPVRAPAAPASAPGAADSLVATHRDAPSPPSEGDAQLLAEIEPLLQQGRWQQIVELVGRREPDPQRLSPRTALLYAVALKEAPVATTGAQPGPRPTVDPDLLGVRAVAALLRLDGQSTTALLVAKRVLRKRPLEWQREPPRRVSIVLTLLALALGTAAGLVFDQHLMALIFR